MAYGLVPKNVDPEKYFEGYRNKYQSYLLSNTSY